MGAVMVRCPENRTRHPHRSCHRS